MSDQSPATPNRRRARRRAPKRSTKIFCYKGPLGLGPNLALAILDLSETGVRAVLKEPLPQKQEVEINLDSLNHRRPLKVMGDVVWCVAAADGTWCVGIQFQRALGYYDYQSMVTT